MKRGHRYAVRLDLGGGPNGKRIFKWHSGYATKRAAQQARTELLGALEQSTYVPPDTTTIAHDGVGRHRPGGSGGGGRQARCQSVPAWSAPPRSLGEFGLDVGWRFSLHWSDGMDSADHCAPQVSRTNQPS
jgi:Arm DNA-binding domain